jgi:hypothetical protein
VKSSGKPAKKAVNEIICRLNVEDGIYIETWEINGKRRHRPPSFNMVIKKKNMITTDF